jgi:environmental stress-induced protein Ves
VSATLLHTVSLAGAQPQPWRNGGGLTHELLAWPGAGDWQCRISVARIDQSGPFSAFPGVERWFAVLSGEGVVLRFGKRRTMLTAGSEPLRFDGASAPGCDLLDGPTQDLNLMLRSDAGRGAMQVARAGEPWHSDAPLRAVFVLDACSLQADRQPLQSLAAGTLVWGEQAAGQDWVLSAGAPGLRAWWLAFKPLMR